MPLDKLVRTLSGDEVETRAIVSKTHKPSFIKSIQVIGSESTNASKLSELSLSFRSRTKLTNMICGRGLNKEQRKLRKGLTE